ncbi:hypothetical protein AURDEDRAFT_115570, partial [Auricularia subglabra TFB-10046 SS5]
MPQVATVCLRAPTVTPLCPLRCAAPDSDRTGCVGRRLCAGAGVRADVLRPAAPCSLL